MTHRIFRNYRLLTVVLVLAIFLAYFLINVDKFKPLADINGPFLIAIGLANIGVVLINGLFMKSILKPFKKFISLSEAFYVSLISSVGNFFAPVGTGFGVRAIYLKKKHGLPYSEFISTLSGNYILVFLVNSLIGLLALYLLRDELNSQYIVLAGAFVSMFGLSLLLFSGIIKIPSPEIKKTINTKIRSATLALYRVTHGWNSIISHRKMMLELLSLTIANFFLAVFIYWAIVHSLHLTITLPALLLFSVLGSLSIFVNITPANLGVKEAIYLFSSSILGFSVSEILLIALIERGVQFTVLLLLWLFVTTTRTKQKVLGNA